MKHFITSAPPTRDFPGTVTVAYLPAKGVGPTKRRLGVPDDLVWPQLLHYARWLYWCVPARQWALWRDTDNSDNSDKDDPIRILEEEEVWSWVDPSDRNAYIMCPGDEMRVRADPSRPIRDAGSVRITLWTRT